MQRHPPLLGAQAPCRRPRVAVRATLAVHDVVTKLNARSRSQDVAFAVREGLI